jgi:hypothetical protein
LGFRECSVADAERLTEWLAISFCESKRDEARVAQEFAARCLAEKIEPPTAGRSDRIVRSALSRSDLNWNSRRASLSGWGRQWRRSWKGSCQMMGSSVSR